jgi:hypothetical protein
MLNKNSLPEQKMIDKTQIIPVILKRLRQLPANEYLELLTYKRNRSLIIIKRDKEIEIIENGYFQQRFTTTQEKLKKLLKTLLKKEFPRSKKVRLYSMGIYDSEKTEEIKRKII